MGKIHAKQETTTPTAPDTGYNALYPTPTGWKAQDDTGTENLLALLNAALTAGRVVFVGTNGSLADDNNLVWDNTNKRLGVGGTPTSKIHVKSTASTLFNAERTGATAAGTVELKRETNLMGTGLTGAYLDSSDALVLGGGGDVSIGANNTEVIRIDTSGQVLINTTTPVSTEKLNVAGDIVVSDGAGGKKISLTSSGEVYKLGDSVIIDQRITTNGLVRSGGGLNILVPESTIPAASTTDIDIGINADYFNNNNRGLWLFNIIGVGEYSNSPHGFHSIVILRTDGTTAMTGTSLSFVSDSSLYLSACTVVSDTAKNLFLRITNSNSSNDISAFIANIRLVESRW